MKKRSVVIIVPVFILLFSLFSFSYEMNFDYKGAEMVSSVAGKEEYRKPDGTVIIKSQDREEAVFKDKTRVVRLKNGNREIFFPDGSEIHMQDDGSVRYVNPDRSERIISMDGKTPYGMDVQEERRVLQRKYFVVELIYSAALSDDSMDDYFKAFFKELEAQIDRWMFNHNLTREKVRIVVSNCRFCKTGFCRRKNIKEVSVILFRDDTEDKKVSFRLDEIIDTKNHTALALGAVEALLGK